MNNLVSLTAKEKEILTAMKKRHHKNLPKNLSKTVVEIPNVSNWNFKDFTREEFREYSKILQKKGYIKISDAFLKFPDMKDDSILNTFPYISFLTFTGEAETDEQHQMRHYIQVRKATQKIMLRAQVANIIHQDTQVLSLTREIGDLRSKRDAIRKQISRAQQSNNDMKVQTLEAQLLDVMGKTKKLKNRQKALMVALKPGVTKLVENKIALEL